jgi:hypothetical protein
MRIARFSTAHRANAPQELRPRADTHAHLHVDLGLEHSAARALHLMLARHHAPKLVEIALQTAHVPSGALVCSHRGVHTYSNRLLPLLLSHGSLKMYGMMLIVVSICARGGRARCARDQRCF